MNDGPVNDTSAGERSVHDPPVTDPVQVADEDDLTAASAPQSPPASSSPRARRRVELLPRTLTARLVTGVTALVVLVVATTGLGTYLYLHRFLYHRLDQQVSAQADAFMGQMNRGVICDITGCSLPAGRGGPPGAPQKQWFVLLDDEGTVESRVSESVMNIKALNLSANQRAAAIAPHNGNTTLTTTDGDEIRVAYRRTQGGYIMLVGLSTGEATSTLHTLLLLEVGVGATGVVVAVGLTALGMRAGLGPLKRVTRTAQEVTAEMTSAGGGLDRRVPQTTSTTEVGQLATSFNTMLDKVEQEFAARRESEERMRQFLADASHELRTPLTSIRGYAELARLQRGRAAGGSSGADRRDGANDDDSIGRIESEGTRMSRLVEDLLLLARGDDAGAQTQRAAVDLGATAAQAADDVRMTHPDRDITCSTTPGLIVSGDDDQLLRVLRNLIGNAAIHTDSARPIAVTGAREGVNVVLRVTDGGPGLPPEEAGHVFERFWRADKARTRVRGGSGLGMSIVAQIVAAHGGQVYFDSSVAQGSTVTLVLPAARPSL